MNKKITTSAERICELIKLLDISQAEFGKSVGLDKSTVSLYANGRREPRQDKISDISEKYDIDPAWLMGYDVPMHKPKIELNAEVAKIDIELLTHFHKLPKEKQVLALQIIKSML